MRTLNTYVHAVEINKDGSHGQSGTFGPGDVVPDWARKAITNPDVWDGEDDEPQNAEPERETTAVKISEPPRGGPGSSADAWRRFAESNDLDVPDGASAKDIQELWDKRS